MASSPSLAQGSTPPESTVPDEDHGVDLPMSMTASVILTQLPKDATQALADVEALDDVKGRLATFPDSTVLSYSLKGCFLLLDLTP